MNHPSAPSAPARPWLGTLCLFGAAAVVSWGVASAPVMAPQPAQAVASLSGSTGATAAALYTTTELQTNILKWPGTYIPGTAPAGTPCSVIDLQVGQPVTMQIQVVGSFRRCALPPAPAPTCTSTNPTTSPPPLIVTQATQGGVAQGVRVTTQPTAILKWQELWSTAQPTPVAGTACSPFDMLPGETTMRHVQVWQQGSLWSRCVDNTLPAYAN